MSTVVMIIYSASLFSQKTISAEKYLEELPKIELEEKTPQRYLMVTDNINYDIYGNFQSKSRVSGEYTRGLKNSYVKWNNVRIANSQKLDETFVEGKILNNMEDLSYVVSDEMANGTFFKVTPETDIQIKTLVWDVFTFEIIAWNFWETLKLNIEYSASDINTEFQIEGLGSIESKDMRITWTGITKKNDKVCAVIKYIAMNNPMDFKMHNTKIKGSTSYWGNIYVSLTDKQIEYGELYEIFVMDIITNGQAPGNKAYSTRNISLEKIN
jgi:hypothetical protein